MSQPRGPLRFHIIVFCHLNISGLRSPHVSLSLVTRTEPEASVLEEWRLLEKTTQYLLVGVKEGDSTVWRQFYRKYLTP